MQLKSHTVLEDLERLNLIPGYSECAPAHQEHQHTSSGIRVVVKTDRGNTAKAHSKVSKILAMVIILLLVNNTTSMIIIQIG